MKNIGFRDLKTTTKRNIQTERYLESLSFTTYTPSTAFYASAINYTFLHRKLITDWNSEQNLQANVRYSKINLARNPWHQQLVDNCVK